MLTDFHIHSTFSDGKIPIPTLIDLYGKAGFGAIAITDHICETKNSIGKAAGYLGKTLTQATFPLYMEILKSEAVRAWEQYRMIVIPGAEITKNALSNADSAHILALGLFKFISADADVLTILQEIKSQGALAIAAHPVHTQKFEKQTYFLWNHRFELSATIDAWEVASGIHLFKEVLETSLPKIANSDLHVFKQFHSWKTKLHCEKNISAIFESIQKQKVDFTFYKEKIDESGL